MYVCISYDISICTRRKIKYYILLYHHDDENALHTSQQNEYTHTHTHTHASYM
ncbi:hypothetical protein OAV88_00275 [bacterium]|nr:hypothetical protein [bacterium]